MSCYETLSIVAQFSVVAATVAYVMFARRQWEEIRRQANISEGGIETNSLAVQAAQQSANAATESAKIADFALKSLERAYLSTKPWQMVNFKEGDKAQAILPYVNVGRTPGWIIAIYYDPYLSEFFDSKYYQTENKDAQPSPPGRPAPSGGCA